MMLVYHNCRLEVAHGLGIQAKRFDRVLRTTYPSYCR